MPRGDFVMEKRERRRLGTRPRCSGPPRHLRGKGTAEGVGGGGEGGMGWAAKNSHTVARLARMSEDEETRTGQRDVAALASCCLRRRHMRGPRQSLKRLSQRQLAQIPDARPTRSNRIDVVRVRAQRPAGRTILTNSCLSAPNLLCSAAHK